MPFFEGKCENDSCPDIGKKVEIFSKKILHVDPTNERFVDLICATCRTEMMRRVFAGFRIGKSSNPSNDQVDSFRANNQFIHFGGRTILPDGTVYTAPRDIIENEIARHILSHGDQDGHSEDSD